jgi:CxxC-x17-CxxC domain-containing protein
MSFADKPIVCRDCGNEFIFTAGEQEFYASKGFVNEPTRCPSCRQARKVAMASGGGGNGGGMRERSEMSSAPRERISHTVTCANCGRETTVPFVPRGHRPVYCSDCFSQMRGSGSSSNRY